MNQIQILQVRIQTKHSDRLAKRFNILNFQTKSWNTTSSFCVFRLPERLSEGAKKILGYVPSAVFPAIIFPAVFFNETNTIVQINDPKIIGFFVAIVIGYISKNIILTIIAGLISYWIVIFLF